MEQAWCFNVEKTSIHNKILLLTTKVHLETAQHWVDRMLPSIYQQHIVDKLDVMTSKWMIPRCLDKPILTAASTAYANKLKQCTVWINDGTTTSMLVTKPSCHNKFQLVGVTFDKKEFPALTNIQNKSFSVPSMQPANQPAKATTNTALPPAQPFNYKAELNCLSEEIETWLKKQKTYSQRWMKNQQPGQTICTVSCQTKETVWGTRKCQYESGKTTQLSSQQHATLPQICNPKCVLSQPISHHTMMGCYNESAKKQLGTSLPSFDTHHMT